VSSGLVDRGGDCVGGAGVGYGGSVACYALGASVAASSTTGASRLQTATVLPAGSASGSASASDGVAGLVVAFSIQLVMRRVSFWHRARSLVRLWAQHRAWRRARIWGQHRRVRVRRRNSRQAQSQTLPEALFSASGSAFGPKLGRLCPKLGALCLHTRFRATGMFSCLGKISLSGVFSAQVLWGGNVFVITGP
jgi:hypothetical protein